MLSQNSNIRPGSMCRITTNPRVEVYAVAVEDGSSFGTKILTSEMFLIVSMVEEKDRGETYFDDFLILTMLYKGRIVKRRLQKQSMYEWFERV